MRHEVRLRTAPVVAPRPPGAFVGPQADDARVTAARIVGYRGRRPVAVGVAGMGALQRSAGNRAAAWVGGVARAAAAPTADAEAGTEAPGEQDVAAPPPALDRVLKVGVQGDDVRRLQELLNARGESLAADGMFGPQTRAAVVRAQQSLGVAADGVVGPQTWGALSGSTPGTGQPPGATPAGPPPPGGPPTADNPPTGDQTQLREWVSEAFTRLEAAATGLSGGAAAPGGGQQPAEGARSPEALPQEGPRPPQTTQPEEGPRPPGSQPEEGAQPTGSEPVDTGATQGQEAPVEMPEPITWPWLDWALTQFLRERVVAGGNAEEDHAARVGMLDEIEAAVTPLQERLAASDYAGLGGTDHERGTLDRFLANVRTMGRFYASLAGSVTTARPVEGGGYSTQQRPEDPRRAQLIGIALADIGKVWAQPPDGKRRGWQHLKHIFDVSWPSHGSALGERSDVGMGDEVAGDVNPAVIGVASYLHHGQPGFTPDPVADVRRAAQASSNPSVQVAHIIQQHVRRIQRRGRADSGLARATVVDRVPNKIRQFRRVYGSFDAAAAGRQAPALASVPLTPSPEPLPTDSSRIVLVANERFYDFGLLD